MKTLILQRICHYNRGNEKGITGVLIEKTGLIPFCVTLELPWNSNKQNTSCIPAGKYVCKKTDSPRFGETFEVLDVFQRTNILFHKGNVNDDTKGCILLGESFGMMSGEPAIYRSKDAFLEFKNVVLKNEDEFILDLRPPCVIQSLHD